MIHDILISISGRTLCITRNKLLQCLVLRYESSVFEKLFCHIYENWSTLYPTLQEFRTLMPTDLSFAEDDFYHEMCAVFNRYDEDIPYNETVVRERVASSQERVDFYQLTEMYFGQACQIAEQARRDLENTPASSFSENTGYIGFGIGGMIGAMLANTATNLVDRGVDRARSEIKLRKYEKQLEELLHGKETVHTFLSVAAAQIDLICTYTIREIAQNTGEKPVYMAKEEKTIFDDSRYQDLSDEDKIDVCIAGLERYPADNYYYDELIWLTKGKNDELAEYGDRMIDEKYGLKTRRKVANSLYNTVAKMEEETLSDIERKISSLEELLDIFEERETLEKDINRLTTLKNDKLFSAKMNTMITNYMSLLERTPIDKLSCEEAFQTYGYIIFIQEIFFSKSNYEKLPDDKTLQRCAELGNGTPLLLKNELLGLNGTQALEMWKYWARKGNPYAMVRLALCRLHGCVIEKDVVRSRQLLLQAAKKSYPPAAYLLRQIAIGKYKPDFGKPTPADKEYAIALGIDIFPEELFKRYRRFGRA